MTPILAIKRTTGGSKFERGFVVCDAATGSPICALHTFEVLTGSRGRPLKRARLATTDEALGHFLIGLPEGALPRWSVAAGEIYPGQLYDPPLYLVDLPINALDLTAIDG